MLAMPTHTTEEIAKEVHEECNAPVDFDNVLTFVQQLHGTFDVEADELIQKSASALEIRYEENILAQDGVIVEFPNGEIQGSI